MSKITKILAREVLDSRGNPTVEVEVFTEKSSGRAIVPSGASTGVHEALELRDGDKKRYAGKGVMKAVENVSKLIAPVVTGMNSENQQEIDKKMLDLDGTENKSRLGANAILGVSMACARATANERGEFLYEYLSNGKVMPGGRQALPTGRQALPTGRQARILPLPMMNIINGGAHADSGLDIQEFMILPVGGKNFKEALRMGAEIFHTLKGLLKDTGHSVSVGDEGGFAPKLGKNEAALDFIVQATQKAGYKPWKEVMIGLDVAASEFYDESKKVYKIKVDGKPEELSNSDLVAYYDVLLRKYPIVSIEDGHAQDDWEGWDKIMKDIGKTIQIVGDDFLVTNVKRLKKAIDLKAANSILIKLNQIGSISETFDAIKMAKAAGWTTVISHRSGETEDTSIADIAVAKDMGFIKTGSLSRTDRICKYNQLLRIEERLGDKADFIGGRAFYQLEEGYKNRENF